MAGIGIVLNPHSRSNRKNPERAHRLGFIVGDKGSCHITDEISQVRQLAELFKRREIEILGISGGDGTYHHTLSTFIDVYGSAPFPKVCFLRGGTNNVVASAIGVHGSPESILSRLIYQYHQNVPFRTVPLSMVRMNGLYGFVFSLGMVANFIRIYDRNKNPSRWSSFCLLTRGFLHCLFNTRWAAEICKRFDAIVRFDGHSWPFKNYVEIMGGTIPSLGFGLKPFAKLSRAPGHFETVGFSLPPRSIALQFPRFALGLIPSRHFLDAVTKKMTVEFAEPQSFFVDGELYDPVAKVEIEIGPQLEIIIP